MPTISVDERTAMGALDVDECLVLLRWEVVGRLAVAAPGESPIVVPVNFVVENGTVVFRTGHGEKLNRLNDQPISLQVDRFDWFRRIGWSVLVRGVAREIPLDDIAHLDLQPWAPGEMPHAIRIEPTSITGRRLELNPSPQDSRGYL
ncbi:MAG: uncharacterized protein QOC92_2821 [Acidimicrobiaceae bacterium]|jgi:nitroimidazol reductase NimA-like FMN-containing flavoprotein (pyridoxamine 5'-phosphate oxidase superfamily)